jgi:hypothetical protein
MTVRLLSFLVALATIAITAAPVRAEAPPRPAAAAPVDEPALRTQAESGDARAQVALGDRLADRFQSTDALVWYQKSAAQGDVEGEFHLGQMLLFGAGGVPDSFAVVPNPPDGLRWTFLAATNLHPMACWNLSKALRRGIGANTNLVESYAWLTVFAQISPGSVAARTGLNEMAVAMDKASVQEAQNLARQFNAGHWRAPVALIPPKVDPGLKLGGVFYVPSDPVAMINGQLFSQGQSAKIHSRAGAVTIKCLKIEKDSVIVEIEGEETPLLLRMR